MKNLRSFWGNNGLRYYFRRGFYCVLYRVVASCVSLLVIVNDNYIKVSGLYRGFPKKGIDKRKEVKKFSQKSRSRLRQKILDHSLRNDTTKFITLTLPHNPQGDFRAMIKLLTYYLKKKSIAMIYKIEYTEAGVLHLHGFVYKENINRDFWEIKKYIQDSWEHCAEKYGVKGLCGVSTCLESIRSETGSAWYVSMYCSKDAVFPDSHTGRFWGVLNSNYLDNYRCVKRYYPELHQSMAVLNFVGGDKIKSLSLLKMWAFIPAHQRDGVCDILNWSLNWDNFHPA